MNAAHWRTARQTAGWTQLEAASRLGVSQPYYSQMERGSRAVPAGLVSAAVRVFGLSPVALPLPPLAMQRSIQQPDQIAATLAALGYPGFAHLKKNVIACNPAELVARALMHRDLDPRLVEAFPWVLVAFHDLDWRWLTAQCKLLNLQNRLGFIVELAHQLAGSGVERQLRSALSAVERSRLVAEDTLCRESMPEAERRWIRKHRSAEAAHWNLLTTLTISQLTHAT